MSRKTEQRIQRLTEELNDVTIQLNREITLRRNVESVLQEREKFFRLLLDATSDGVWDRNIRTGEVYYGENWARMLGYAPREVIEKNIKWEDLLHPDDKSRALDAVRAHLEGDTSRYVAEFRMRNKAGEWQWVLARGKVVEWDEEGRPLRFVGTHYDISDRKDVEDELQESSRKIKEFAYSVVHDLKNPAISIHGLAKKLTNKYCDVLDQKGVAFCEQILRSSEQIAVLVDKINLFIAAREAPLFPQNVSLKETFAIIREEFSLQLDLRAVKWIEPPTLPEITADRLSLLRVLRNFVDNSMKYGGEKLAEIELGYRDSPAYHILFVRDNGVGLEQEDSKGIFGMFKRKKTSKGIEGTGLGLAIVKEIAAQHGGRVWFEPDLKKGGIIFYISVCKGLQSE
ncbi:MAG: PAS domain-containing protein [Pseudomonadota bacterium]